MNPTLIEDIVRATLQQVTSVKQQSGIGFGKKMELAMDKDRAKELKKRLQ